jgi:hypothetical protein
LSSYFYKIQRYDAGGIFVDNLQDWTSLGLNDNVAHNDLALTHDNQYSLHIRAIDVAGNISEIVNTDTIRRINSAPIITAILDTTQSYEDVLFTQTILFTDVDTATISGDQFTYNLLTYSPIWTCSCGYSHIHTRAKCHQLDTNSIRYWIIHFPGYYR